MNILAARRNSHQRILDTLLFGFGLLFTGLAISLILILLVDTFMAITYEPVASRLQPELAPIQTLLNAKDASPIVWEREGYTWTLLPRAQYEISARVLSKKRYRDDVSAVMPLDLALGWGEMSDPAVDKWIRWRQADRWYYYQWQKDGPYRAEVIGRQSANVHVIPATDNLAHSLNRLRFSDLVLLEGLLVDVNSQQGEQSRSWYTSLSRTDSGGGACEIFYVTRLVFNGNEYR